MNIDQNAVSAKTAEYTNQISDDITADISPVQTDLTNKKDALVRGFELYLQGKIMSGEIAPADLTPEKTAELLDEFMAEQDFSEFTEKYLISNEQFALFFKGMVGYSLSGDEEIVNQTIKAFSITVTEIVMKSEILTAVGGLTQYLSTSFANAFSLDQEALLSAFKLNFSEEELSRVVSAMFDKSEATLSTNLALMGYQDLDDPFRISFYFNSFDSKTKFMEFVDNYNVLMESYGQNDKVIEYTDTTGILMGSVKVIVDAVSYVLIAFVSISLVVSSIMIGVITYISVYERTKEIGILRAIGASKHNISSIFNAETFIVGLLSGLFGISFSYLAIPLINLVLHHFTGDIPLSAQLYPNAAMILILLSIVLTLIGGLIPARAASKKDPVEALRSE